MSAPPSSARRRRRKRRRSRCDREGNARRRVLTAGSRPRRTRSTMGHSCASRVGRGQAGRGAGTRRSAALTGSAWTPTANPEVKAKDGGTQEQRGIMVKDGCTVLRRRRCIGVPRARAAISRRRWGAIDAEVGLQDAGRRRPTLRPMSFRSELPFEKPGDPRTRERSRAHLRLSSSSCQLWTLSRVPTSQSAPSRTPMSPRTSMQLAFGSRRACR